MREPAKQRDRVRVRGNLHTFSLIALIIAMGYAGGVQANGAAYLLAFLTAALGAMSFIHARANLRGLHLVPGQMPEGRAGSPGRPAVEIRAESGQSPCALEVLAVGAKRAVLIEKIRSGESTRVFLDLPPQEAGAVQHVALLLRSSYPLGLFSAERRVEIDCLRKIHPRPEGSLPLPEAVVEVSGDLALPTRANSTQSREGEDFAGLREWQMGDSPRHIDWRATARGRPLMVKTWSSGSAAAVKLDWDEVPLAESDRPAQMAKWIEMCEQQGRPYSLVLPGIEVPAGLGPSQKRRCLNALAEVCAKSAVATETAKKPARVPQSQERAAHLPVRPLILLGICLMLVALPLWEIVGFSSLALLLGCLVWRIVRGSTSGKWLPVAVAAAGIAAIIVGQGTLLSMEGGIAVLVVPLGGKVLEARSPHDFQILTMVGWFLCLCAILAEQTLGRSLFVFAIFICMVGCTVRFRRASPGIAPPLRLTGVLLLQALPLAALLFFVFPRGSFDYLAKRFGSARTSITGMPSELDPGDIARVAMSDGVAFRAKFPGAFLPPNQMRYWRCVVLWESWGLNWRRGQLYQNPLRGPYTPQPQDIRQVIDMEPNGQHWVPALDKPVSQASTGGRLILDFDSTVRSMEPVQSARRVEVISRPNAEPARISRAEREAALQLPPQVPADMKALADEWRSRSQSDVDIVQAGLLHLRGGGYTYALDPGTYQGRDGLEEFWSRRRKGFCGHYAASYALMMRIAGVPSRVIMGYLGGEWNDRGSYLIVNQSDAHAWVEVWLESSGWTRIDPTAALVPQRLNFDLQTSLLGDEETVMRQRNSLFWQAYQSGRLFWDHVSYQWYNYIIDFDEATQEEWLHQMGLPWLGYLRTPLLLAVSGFTFLLTLFLLNVLLRRPARHSDPWARAWHQLCRRLVRLGLPAKQSSEGPLAYASRVGPTAPPGLAAEVDRLASLYAAARYGGVSASLKQFKRSIKALKTQA